MDILITVLSGTAVAVLGLTLNTFLDQVVFARTREFSGLKGRIAEALIFYANVYTAGVDLKGNYWEEAQTALRKLAAQTLSFKHRRIWLLIWLPSRTNLDEVGRALIGLSNLRDALDPTTANELKLTIEDRLSLKI